MSPTVTCCTWTFVIGDIYIYIYIYIYINQPSDRLALCPRRSNQNPAQIPYFDFAFLWLWLTMISSRKDACARALTVLWFFPYCIGCSAALRDKLDLDFFDKRSVLLYPSFTHKRSTIHSFIHSYIYLGRIAEKQGWMLIKATLLTELPEKKRKEREEKGRKRKDKKDLKCACGILRGS